MSIFVWVGILSSLVIYSMASDDAEWRVYLHGQAIYITTHHLVVLYSYYLVALKFTCGSL